MKMILVLLMLTSVSAQAASVVSANAKSSSKIKGMPEALALIATLEKNVATLNQKNSQQAVLLSNTQSSLNSCISAKNTALTAQTSLKAQLNSAVLSANTCASSLSVALKGQSEALAQLAEAQKALSDTQQSQSRQVVESQYNINDKGLLVLPPVADVPPRTLPSFVTIMVNGQMRSVKNCAAPTFMTMNPQPGISAAQTCACSWGEGKGAYALTCAMPTGTAVMQTANPQVYMLTLADNGKMVPVERIGYSEAILQRQSDRR